LSDPARTAAGVALVGLGCRVSRADLDGLAAALPAGTRLVGPGAVADLVVVGTCTITADADRASRRAIRRASRDFPGARIVAAGCYAERCPEALVGLPGVAAVVGARSQRGLPAVLSALVAGAPPVVAAPPGPAWDEAGAERLRHVRPVLKVQDGCDQACRYCAVPAARGPSASMPFDAAVRRAVALRGRHAELVLAGVHLGAYGRDLAPARSLAELVREVARGDGGRVRLSSIEPLEVPLELFGEPAVRDRLCPHLHLPLQSGSARVLEAMGRPCRPDDLAAVVREAAAAIPGACIGADVMAGFPGETLADHRATLDLVSALPLAYLHVFPYSPRPGTPAATLAGAVPADERRARAAALRALSSRRWAAFLAGQVGRTLEVVTERVGAAGASGTSREFVPVRWPGGAARRGDRVVVRITRSDGTGCRGEAV
jgi:threonylcarbamoyladenosine tRNA methylthiotransferase MtaB